MKKPGGVLLFLAALLVLAGGLVVPGGSVWAQELSEPPRPDGFSSIRLGMELDTVKELLQQDPLFAYRGDPDVSLLPQPQQTLIECAGTTYIRRAFFQFHERSLYIMILALDPARLDYYTVYSTLKAKYGDPDRLDPSESVWEFEGLRLSLERPLSVKYIDTGVFQRLQEEAQAGEDLRALAKERFLERF
ncbi:MAG: hypothetical protein JW820_08400 [Spirochaetales bacterium]|nr:hypothetical protein [Spirochaetales bacterium]